jgi:protoporphyrinogen oxidase
MRVAVIGAGIAGLAAGHRLAEAGHVAHVYERWPGLGGQAATLDVGQGHLLERYYHHLFTSDRHISELYEELGMPNELEWRPSSVAFFVGGRSWPFNGPLDLLRFRPLSLPRRLRMGLAVVLLQRRGHDLRAFENQTAQQWVVRAMGKDAWDKIWGPLLRGKFGDRATDISMAWLWSKLRMRRQIRGEEARQELLGYPRRSWEPLFERLQDSIESRGGQVMIARPARRLSRRDGRFVVEPGGPESFRTGHDPRRFPPAEPPEEYDGVIATVPTDVFERLLSNELAAVIGRDYLDRAASIEYHTALCLLLELDRQFTTFYWTTVADDTLPFVGLIEHTNFIEPERYGGRRFLYIANYCEAGQPMLGLDIDQLLDLYEPGLRQVNPAFSRAWIKKRWLFREPAAQPIVTLGYRDRMPPLDTGVPGLILANTTQIYPEDRGTNYSVRLGDQAVEALMRSSASSSARSTN